MQSRIKCRSTSVARQSLRKPFRMVLRSRNNSKHTSELQSPSMRCSNQAKGPNSFPIQQLKNFVKATLKAEPVNQEPTFEEIKTIKLSRVSQKSLLVTPEKPAVAVQMNLSFCGASRPASSLKVKIGMETTNPTQRIREIEECLARKYSEAYMYRTQYYAQQSMPLRSKLKETAHIKTDILLLNKSEFLPEMSKPSISSETSYGQDYPKQKNPIKPTTSFAPRKQYELNRQLLPRSSYSSEYLAYEAQERISFKPQSSRNLLSISHRMSQSVYQDTFKPTAIDCRVSYKDLSCCRNNFSQPKISFMNHSKKTDFAKVSTKQLSDKINKPFQIRQQSNLLGLSCRLSTTDVRNSVPIQLKECQNMSRMSETKQNYKWPSVYQENDVTALPLRSEIKNRNLQRLTYSVRIQDHKNYKVNQVSMRG